MGEGQGLEGVLVLAELLFRLLVVEEDEAGRILFPEEVVGEILPIHRVLGLGGGHEDVVGTDHLVGDAEGLGLEARERLGEDPLVFDRKVVESVEQSARRHGVVS